MKSTIAYEGLLTRRYRYGSPAAILSLLVEWIKAELGGEATEAICWHLRRSRPEKLQRITPPGKKQARLREAGG